MIDIGDVKCLPPATGCTKCMKLKTNTQRRNLMICSSAGSDCACREICNAYSDRRTVCLLCGNIFSEFMTTTASYSGCLYCTWSTAWGLGVGLKAGHWMHPNLKHFQLSVHVSIMTYGDHQQMLGWEHTTNSKGIYTSSIYTSMYGITSHYTDSATPVLYTSMFCQEI